MKKFLSLFLAALMVMSCFGSLAVTAAGYVTSTLAVECTKAGADGLEEDQFRVDLVVYNNPGISGYQFSLAFDNELIQVVDVVREYDEDAEEDVVVSAFPTAPTLNIDDPSVNLDDLDRVTAVASRANASKKNGVYLSFIFQIVGDFGETALTIEDALFVTNDMREIRFDIVNGTFKNSSKSVQNVTVSAPSSIVLGTVGSKVAVTVNEGNNVAPTFSSSDEKVLRIDSNGNITPVDVGTATVTVKVAGNSTYSAFTKNIQIAVVGGLEGQIGSGIASAGNVVSIPVNVTQNPGISGYQLEFTYDSSKLSVKGVESGDILSATPTYVEQSNKVTVSASHSASSASLGTLFILNFEVDESAPHGTYDVKFNSDNSYAENQAQFSVIFADGTVTVTDYAVTYDANGGTGAPAAQIKKHGQALTLSSVALTRFDYIFCGWLGSDGKTYRPGDTYTDNASLTLTAIWEDDPNIVTGSCGSNLTFVLTVSSGVLEISGTGAMQNYTSASKAPWSAYAGSVKSVKLPDGITTIGSYAFCDCVNLTSVSLPATVESIGDCAFKGSGIASLTVFEGLTSIGKEAFASCASLESVSFESRDVVIGTDAFSGGLNTVYCYRNSTADTYFTSGGVKKIYFDGEPEQPEIPEEVYEYVVNSDGISVTVTKYNGKGGDVVIPAKLDGLKVTAIGESAFEGCDSITSLTVPDSVASIATGAFDGCNALTTVYCRIGGVADKYFVGSRYRKFYIISVYGVSLNKDSAIICRGDSLALEAAVAPLNATYKNVSWKSSDTSVATVDGNGVVTAKSSGKATITAVTEDGEYTASCSITVFDPDTCLKGQIASVSCNAGGTVDVAIYVTDNPGIAGYQFAITYDHTKLHLVGAKNGMILSAEPTFNFDEPNFAENGTVYFTASQTTDSDAVGELIVLTFEAYSKTPKGTYTIECNTDFSMAANQSHEEFRVIMASGSVSVGVGYSVSYNANGGAGAPSMQTKSKDVDLTLATAVPTKDGYSFKGWLGSDGKSYQPGDTYTANADLTLSAVWEIKTYTITYNANGGVGAPANATKEHFATYTVGAAPAKDGYNFRGWLGSDGKTYQSGDAYTGNADLTLTAVWEIKTYTITYDANGGTGAPATATKEHFATYTVGAAPVKDGYNFRGWLGSDGKTYQSGDAYTGDADIALTAVWEIKTYTITYNANGGTGAPATATKEHFATYTVSATAPAKDGYNFRGWLGSDGKTYQAGDVYTANADLTLTAAWEIKTYTVTYNANGGTGAPAAATKEHFATYTVGAAPTKFGYDFKGWLGSDGETYQAGGAYTGNADLTLTAAWAAKSVTLVYDANGGTSSVAEKSVIFDSTVGELITPVKVGYSFIGWFTAKEGGEEINADVVVDFVDTKIIYARWTANSYTVTLDAVGGTTDTASKTVTFDGTYGTLPVPAIAGYTFDGWYTAKVGGELVTSETAVKTAADHTLYARYVGIPYNVTLDSNGGECDTDSKTVVFGEKFGTLPSPTRTGYSFISWSDTKTGENAVTAETVYSTTSDMTLYAIWKANSYKVIFDARGGKTSASEINVTYDSAFGELPLATKQGYNFNGWYFDEACTSRVTADTIVKITSDITLYASYSIIPGAIIFGDANSDGEINAKDSVILAQHLAGWDTDINHAAADCNGDGEINAKDSVLLAQYLAGWDVKLGGDIVGGDVEIPGDDLVGE